MEAEVDGAVVQSYTCPGGYQPATIERDDVGDLNPEFDTSFQRDGESIPETNKESEIASAFLCPGGACGHAKMQVDLSKSEFNSPLDER